MEKTNSRERKQTNKARIAKFILEQGETSKLEIAAKLGISMPTVLQNVKELVENQVVTEVGEYQSTGGRKAKALSIAEEIRYSAGIDITANHISFVIINVKGNLVHRQRIRKEFENSLDYFECIDRELNQFIDKSLIDKKKLLGAGIALPGIIDKENEMLIRSHILQLRNISLRTISQMIRYDVCFENDANSAAMAELSSLGKNAVYLSLSNTVGGAIYMNDTIYPGDNYKSAEFGHIIIETDGEPCYCGKKGCVDAYCSARVLSRSAGDNLEEFFKKLDQRDESSIKIWEKYLDYLAITVTNLRMLFDCDIILGGYVGGYLENYMPELYRRVMRYNRFESDTAYLLPCKYRQEASAVGIAMHFIESYFESL